MRAALSIGRRSLTLLSIAAALSICSPLVSADSVADAELISGWRFEEGADVKVKSADGKDGDRFGTSASVCGSFAYVGAPNDRMNLVTVGSVYGYRSVSDSWVLADKLYPGELGADGDKFGSSVHCDQNTTAVGAPYDSALFESGGAVYVYIRRRDGIRLSAKLTSYSGEDNELFGHSVAVWTDLVVVGAVGSSQAGRQAGVVYTFRRDREQTDDFLDDDGSGHDDRVPVGWKIEAVLYPADISAFDMFGYSLAASGGVIVVGSPYADGRRGAVYVYNRTLVYNQLDDDLYDDNVERPPSYVLLSRLTAGEGTRSREFFGTSVAIDAHTIVVGEPLGYDDTYETQRGAVHVFTTHTSGQDLFTWTRVAVLTEPVYPHVMNRFGQSVAVRKNTVLVGATGSDYFINPTVYAFGRYKTHSEGRNRRSLNSGYLYLTSGDEFSYWSNQATLVPGDRSDMQSKGVVNDMFGTAVSISTLGFAIIGAPATFGGRSEPSGGVYAYIGKHVDGGSASTDDDPPPVDWEQGGIVETRFNKNLMWLVLLIIPAVVLSACIYFCQRRKRRRNRSIPSTMGRSFGEGTAARANDYDNASDISDFQQSDTSFRGLRGRVKNQMTVMSTHARNWIDGAVQNPILVNAAASPFSDDISDSGMDESNSSESSLWRFGGKNKRRSGYQEIVPASRSKRTTQQVLATARAVANDMSHPNQEEVAVLLRTHEKEWITEEKFMETLEELVY